MYVSVLQGDPTPKKPQILSKWQSLKNVPEFLASNMLGFFGSEVFINFVVLFGTFIIYPMGDLKQPILETKTYLHIYTL